MIYFAQFEIRLGWRIRADYTAIGGTIIDISGAASEHVARETCRMMNEVQSCSL